MEASTLRKGRLERLLELAQAYRGWNRKDLAKALGRDPTKLVPGTGIPKLDLVVQLAGVLDWPVGDVVGYLWHVNGVAEKAASGVAETFETVDAAAREAHREGRYQDMADLARKAYELAQTPDQRALSCNRSIGAWDGMGRYTELVKAARLGLGEPGVSADIRRVIQANLAVGYYSLWSLVESRSIAQEMIDWYAAHPPESFRDRRTHGFALYVSGNSYRRLISIEPQRARELAGLASVHLEQARRRFIELAAERPDAEYLAGVANTCAGGLIETEVELGLRDPPSALAEYLKGLDRVGDDCDKLVGDWLESYGWWCIFGCNVALRHVSSERELQQHMAVFTNKADEIANRLDNWAMRERVFTMHYTRWERASGATGFQIPCVIDTEDVRIITGAMGRFPTFRETGWRILRSAQVVGGN